MGEHADTMLTPLVVGHGLRRVEDLLTAEQRRRLRDDLVEMERCRRQALAFVATYVVGEVRRG